MRAARIARLRAWKAEVDAIGAGAATLVDANDVKLLRAELDSVLNELVVRETDRKDYAAPSLRLVDALFLQFLHLPIVGRDGARQADVDRAWDDIVARLEQGPAFIAAGQRLVTRPGRLFGTVGSRRIAGVPDFLAGALSEAAAVQLAGRPDVLARRTAELRAFVREHDVVTVPAWLGTMEIVETPAFLQPVSSGASMHAPRRFSTATTGYYFITPPTSLAEAAERLDMNQDFDRDRIWSTAAHEAMPGHFLQLSIARRHPDFVRRIVDDSALAEGWAFYGEEMFVRLGLYGDGLDARLFTARWERVRGARAIVDPKLASGEWTIAQAVDFFVAQSGFTRSAAEAAVDGIALNPGYVISYTVGRFQLQMLLAEYLVRTGEHGSLRDFHDRLLSYGAVPFAVLGPELLADLDKPASAVRAAANY